MTISEIKNTICEAYISDPVIIAKYGLDESKTFGEQFSVVSLESILFYAVSVAIWMSSTLFDQHKIDMETILSQQLVHRTSWYAYKAKLFQFGFELNGDTDNYNNAGATEAQIAASRVVKYSAAITASDKSILFLKIATDNNGKRQPLPENQLTAFSKYINKVADAGVRIRIVNDKADDIRLVLDIYYNPLVLDSLGARLDGSGDTPIQDVVRAYLNNLPFNGTYINMRLVDEIQNVDGVEIVELKSAASRYGVYTDFTEINAREVAHSGYYEVSDENLIINFISNE